MQNYLSNLEIRKVLETLILTRIQIKNCSKNPEIKLGFKTFAIF